MVAWPTMALVVLARDLSQPSSPEPRAASLVDTESELQVVYDLFGGAGAPDPALLRGPTRTPGQALRAAAEERTVEEIPPSTVALDRGSQVLRRDESVVAELQAMRRPGIIRFFDAVGTVVLEDLPARARLLFSPARRLRRASHGELGPVRSVLVRLDRLSKTKKAVIVLTPYLMAIALGGFLVERRSITPAEAKPIQPVASAATAQAPAPAPIAPPIVTAPVEIAAQRTLPEIPERDIRRLERSSALFSRPSSRAKSPVWVEAGAELELLSDVPAKKGWVLARKVDTGHVGYLSKRHLAGKSHRSVDKRVKRAAKKRRRRR